MSKADELLKHLYFQFTDTSFAGKNYKEFKRRTLSNELVKDIENYLNRKDKLVAGSEWVCDVECCALLYHETYYFKKNDCVVINNKEHSEIELTHTDEWYKGAIFWMPIEQFLACFSPKEEE